MLFTRINVVWGLSVEVWPLWGLNGYLKIKSAIYWSKLSLTGVWTSCHHKNLLSPNLSIKTTLANKLKIIQNINYFSSPVYSENCKLKLMKNIRIKEAVINYKLNRHWSCKICFWKMQLVFWCRKAIKWRKVIKHFRI